MSGKVWRQKVEVYVAVKSGTKNQVKANAELAVRRALKREYAKDDDVIRYLADDWSAFAFEAKGEPVPWDMGDE